MSSQKSAIKNNQKGRTLLEILAVLAIMSALTATGLILYSQAGSKRDANLIYEDILVQSEHIRHRGGATGKSIFDSSIGNKTRTGLLITSTIASNSFSITVHDIPEKDCADLSRKNWPEDSKIKIDTTEYQPNAIKCNINQNFDLTVVFSNGGNDDENLCANITCLACQECQEGYCINTCESGDCIATPAKPNGECYIDLCANINCGKHGYCSDGECICLDAWSGNNCETPPICNCEYGSCVDGVCICQDGWEGERCDIDQLCADINCGEHGECIEGICVCRDDYFGEFCEKAPLQCTNYGTWDSETNTCICSNSWRGERCERPPYTGNDVGSCDNGNVYLTYMTNPCGTESPTPEKMLCAKNSDCDNGYYCNLDSDEGGTNSAPNKGECKALTSGKDINFYNKEYKEFKVGPSLSWWSAQNWCSAHKLEQPDLSYLGLKIDPGYCTGSDCKGVNFSDLKNRLGSGWFWASNSRTKDTEVAYGIQTSSKMIDELWHNGKAITLCVYPNGGESAMQCRQNSDCENGTFCNLTSSESHSEPDASACEALAPGQEVEGYLKGPALTWWGAQNWCEAHDMEQTTLSSFGFKNTPANCTGTECKGIDWAWLKDLLGSNWFWTSDVRSASASYGIQPSEKKINSKYLSNTYLITLCGNPEPPNKMQCLKNTDCKSGYFCNLTSSESHSEPDASVCEALSSGQQVNDFLKGPALTWWGAQNWCEAHDMELTSLFSLGLTSTPANCTGTNCKGINWTKIKSLLGSNWFWTSDVRSASASYGIQSSEKKINSKYLSNTYLIALCGTKPIYTNDDVGICENGNVYLSYMEDPCATETPQDMQCHKNSDCENGYFCDLTSSGSALKPDAGVCNKLTAGQKLNSYLKGPALTWWSAQNWCKAHNMDLVSLSRLGMTISPKDCNQNTCTGINWTNLKNLLGSNWFWTSDNRDGNVAYGIQPSYQQVDGQYHSGSIYTLCSSD